MNKTLRWRIIVCLAVFAAFFTLGVYPILAQRFGLPAAGWLKARQLRLGLDLRGGVHLVLRVHTDEALRLFTTATGEQLREELKKAGVNVASIATVDDI